MPKLSIKKQVSLEELRDALTQPLGPSVKLSISGSRLNVAQDGFRGCVVRAKPRGTDSDVITGPFIPSTGLAVMLSLMCVGAAFALMFFVNVVVGAVLLPATIMLRLLPSQEIVNRVTEALKRHYSVQI